MTEEWSTVKRSTDHEISNCGKIRRRIDSQNSNFKKGFVLKQQFNRKGYKYVLLYINRKRTTCLIHRLVLEAFVGPCPNGMNTNHKNGIKDDNNLSNLEWVTYSENLKHAFRLGLNKPQNQKGEKNKNAKLKNKDIRHIRKLLASDLFKQKNYKLTQTKIAKMFGVPQQTISAIKMGIQWFHIKYKENCV